MSRSIRHTRLFPALIALICAPALLAPAAARADALADYRAAVSADNPIGYWHLDETSGSVATDFGSAGANGSYAGTLTLGASSPFGSPVNKAVNFSSLGTMTASVPGHDELGRVLGAPVAARRPDVPALR